MSSLEYQFSLLSDTFAHGAYQTQNFNRPELRAPSVKGMIRWWFKALGHSEADADILFGSIKPVAASRIVIRVHPIEPAETASADFMPHKGQRGGSKTAIQPGSLFHLSITQRREPLPEPLWLKLQQAVEAWLLLGAIGQRSNRAAGSILWDKSPRTQPAFELKASELLEKSKIRFAVLKKDFGNDDIAARNLAGRFPNTRDYQVRGFVFGTAGDFKQRIPRKPSPLKLRVVLIDESIRLLAIWVPENPFEDTESNLRGGLDLMGEIEGKAELARLLKEVLPRLTV